MDMQERKIIEDWKPNKKELVEFGIFCLEKILPIWEANFPKDKRPKKVIKIAKKFLQFGTEGTVKDIKAIKIIKAAEEDALAAAEMARNAAWEARDTPGNYGWATWMVAWAAYEVAFAVEIALNDTEDVLDDILLCANTVTDDALFAVWSSALADTENIGADDKAAKDAAMQARAKAKESIDNFVIRKMKEKEGNHG